MQVRLKMYAKNCHGTCLETENNLADLIGNCKIKTIKSTVSSSPTDIIIIYDGSKDELAKRLIELDLYDEYELKEAYSRMEEIEDAN